MIHIDRGRVRRPPWLQSARTKAALGQLEDFFARPLDSRLQETHRFDTDVYSGHQVRDALRELFHDKCAYCETFLSSSVPLNVDQFRPKAQAVSTDGSVAPDGYWWLAYEWTNLYPTCRNCNHLKGPRFPIRGSRAAPRTFGEALRQERPLILDPCYDHPESHLVFSEDGPVASETEEGRTSINVLGLNRESLIAQRRASIAALLTGLQGAAKGKPDVAALREKLAGDHVPFAGARRQFLAAWLAEAPRRVKGTPRVSAVKGHARKVIAEFETAQQVQESYSITDEGAKEHYFVRTRAIARIEIHNFRPIADLTLAFSEPDREIAESRAVQGTDPQARTPWLMLLGENGAGKSSVLQAVALTLIGETWRNRLQLDASRYVRRGETEGYVKVHLTGIPEPIELTFSSQSTTFDSKPTEPKVLLLGYGSTRLLPRPGMETAGSYDFARIDNLLNPFVPLNDAAAWLATIDESTFQTVARALRAVLQLSEGDKLVQGPTGIEAEIFGSRVSLDELSDGYQSVVALATDIMRVMLKRWSAMEVAEGIVILDEIGSHLHPRWRMRVVDALRRTFPRVQFLASTHDPLCLRGLTTGEVAVFKRDASHRVVALTDLPPIAGLRVDQLLTSEYFGLNSTIDPEMEAVFTEYYKLLALRTPDPAQRTRIGELKAHLEKFRVLGANQRERLMLDAIDESIALERANPVQLTPTQRAATKKKLLDIWAKTPPAPRPRGGSRT